MPSEPNEPRFGSFRKNPTKITLDPALGFRGAGIFEGNRANVATAAEMVWLMEEKYGKAKRVWVMDRGIVSENNLVLLREREAYYPVGTPKGQLCRFGQELHEGSDWSEVRPGVEVKLVDQPDGKGGEQHIVARSKDRRERSPPCSRPGIST